MKKSFMTRVLAVSLSAAMAFSMSSASNLMTASAASTVNLKTTFKTLKVNQTYKMTLKKNTLNWKITKVTTTNKKICTVYGKTASSVMLKGKGVGRAKITVKVKTTKRKYPKNIKNMKCTVNVKAAGPSTEDVAFSATAAANSNTEVRVNFTKAVDAAAVENFKIAEENVSVSKAELSEDKKSVLLTIAGAEYSKNYNLTVTGIKVGGTVQADQKLTFTTPSPEVLNPTTLTAERAILKSDGQDATTITFKITDKDGKPLTDKGMEVRFTTNLGKFATDRVSIQNGEAKVMYTSEALSENHTAVITATIIEAPADTKLIGTTATTSVTLMPNPDQIDDTSIGATLTSITAPTADRIYAYFNKEVKAEDFRIANGKEPNTKKFEATIKSGLDNGYGEADQITKDHKIVGILPVENDPKALQLLVDTPMVDNSIVKVEFENKTQTNGIYIPKNTAYCKLTDARQPAVVSINAEDQRTIKIEFSEAVLRQTDCDGTDKERQLALAAETLENYQIDGVQLSNKEYWGDFTINNDKEKASSGSSASTLKRLSSKEIGDDTNRNGEIKVGLYDERNVVTIKLGRKKYLGTGTHRLSIANVGDWAAKTDKERNIVSTEGFDFDVAADTSAPTFTATAMSPEQYLLEFNTEIVPVSDSDKITTEDSSALSGESVIKLEAKNANGTWSEISNVSTGTGKNNIMVSRVKEDGSLTNKYLVEVKRDWTDVYKTSSTRDNYYRHEYRLTIDADKIQNPVNGLKNAALSVALTDDIMRSADGKSPEIEKIEDAEGNIGSYNVYMTEPVKMSKNANKEGLTPSETQNQNQNQNQTQLGVPAPEAQFVHVGDGHTVEGIIDADLFVDAYDQIINIAPATELGNGEWDLIVRSISDDIGNTAPTLTKRITIDNPVTQTNFRVVWAAVGYDEGAYNYDKAADYGEAVKEAERRNNQGNCIYVKFNKPVTLFGSSTNAQSISNYTLNGAPLPTGTEIRAHIKGYDEAVGTNVNVTDSVTIVLPRDRFSGNIGGSNGIYTVSSLNTMLNISKTVTCSTTNELLDNGGLIRIPFQFGSAADTTGGLSTTITTDKSSEVVHPISSLNIKTDAVWGNSKSEMYTNGDGTIKSKQEYYEAVKEALENEKYRKVILSDSIDLTNLKDDDIVNVFGRSKTLNIKRVVDLDLNGKTIKGNVVVSTDTAADEMHISSSANAKGRIIGTDNAVLTVNAGRVEEFYIQNIEVSRETSTSSDKPVILLNDAWVNTFNIAEDVKIDGDIDVTDSNGFGLKNDSKNWKGNLFINGSGKANLSGDLTDKNIEVNQASELAFPRGVKVNESTTIRIASSGAKVFLANMDGKPQIIAAAKDIQVCLPEGKSPQDVAVFRNEANCGFVEIDEDGKKEDTNSFAKPDAVQKTDIAYALDTINILPEAVVAVDNKTEGNVVITTGAISGSGFKLSSLRDTIKARDLENADGDAFGKLSDVTVSLKSENLVKLEGDTVKVRDDIDAVTKTDEIIVRLTYRDNGVDHVVDRKITIKKA